MNNKRLGTEFERELCEILTGLGWWTHFITPNAAGAQPFDIVAVKDNCAIAIDCKTSARPSFPITRLEDNQRFAFDKWLRCGNVYALLAVKYEGKIYFIDYEILLDEQTVRLSDYLSYEEWLEQM